MDWCFRREKERKRKVNAEKARESRAKFEEAKAKLGQSDINNRDNV